MITNVASDRGGFTSNVHLLAGERPVVIDAGKGFDAVGAIREHVGDIDALVLTHDHPDHVGTLEAITEAFEVDCWAYDTENALVDRGIADGDVVQLGDREYEALFTPGHAVDHLCFLSRDGEVLLSGDLIFPNGNVGRTDFEGGDPDALAESVNRVADLVDSSLQALYAGHGPSVTENAAGHVARARETVKAHFGQ